MTYREHAAANLRVGVRAMQSVARHAVLAAFHVAHAVLPWSVTSHGAWARGLRRMADALDSCAVQDETDTTS